MPAVRKAVESIRSDRRETMSELRATLTVEQMRELRTSSPGLGRTFGRSGGRFGIGGQDRFSRSRGRPVGLPGFRGGRGAWPWTARSL